MSRTTSKHRTTTRPDKRRKIVAEIERAFNRDRLAQICAMDEEAFPILHNMDRVECPDSVAPFYAYKDNGSKILAVAHLDTVANPDARAARFTGSAAGPVVFSRGLDDRLGAYVVADLLPRLGITCDLLVTTGEEIGRSTAQYFEPSKEYNWVIEFDRGGTDVVLYDYADDATEKLVKQHATLGIGSYSDIAWMEHVGVKAFNWGVGYRDYHSARSHAFLSDTFDMVSRFVGFWNQHKNTRLDHISTYEAWCDSGKTYDSGNDSGKGYTIMSDCAMCGVFTGTSRSPLYGVDLCRLCERGLDLA